MRTKVLLKITLFIFLSIIFTLGNHPLSIAKEVIKFKVKGSYQNFTQEDSLHLMVSENCGELLLNSKCQAVQSLKKVSYQKAVPFIKPGKNPGLVLCSQVLRGKIVIGTDLKGSQNSFCSFDDQSMIDSGSLIYYGLLNDKKYK